MNYEEVISNTMKLDSIKEKINQLYKTFEKNVLLSYSHELIERFKEINVSFKKNDDLFGRNMIELGFLENEKNQDVFAEVIKNIENEMECLIEVKGNMIYPYKFYENEEEEESIKPLHYFTYEYFLKLNLLSHTDKKNKFNSVILNLNMFDNRVGENYITNIEKDYIEMLGSNLKLRSITETLKKLATTNQHSIFKIEDDVYLELQDFIQKTLEIQQREQDTLYKEWVEYNRKFADKWFEALKNAKEKYEKLD